MPATVLHSGKKKEQISFLDLIIFESQLSSGKEDHMTTHNHL